MWRINMNMNTPDPLPQRNDKNNIYDNFNVSRQEDTYVLKSLPPKSNVGLWACKLETVCFLFASTEDETRIRIDKNLKKKSCIQLNVKWNFHEFASFMHSLFSCFSIFPKPNCSSSICLLFLCSLASISFAPLVENCRNVLPEMPGNGDSKRVPVIWIPGAPGRNWKSRVESPALYDWTFKRSFYIF